MFYAHNRKGYVDNPRYLMEYLDREFPGMFELIWVSAWPETCEFRPGIEVVGRRSFQFFLKYIRTKIFVTNDMVDENLIKKRGQVYLSTWHGGGAYKRVGMSACKENEDFARVFGRYYGRLDYFVSSCKKCSEFYPDAFGLSMQRFLAAGMPRNDLFFEDHAWCSQKVREFYHLEPNTRILLYAPSFRLFYGKELWDDIQQMMEPFNKKESWVCIYRVHYFMTDTMPQFLQADILNGNKYFEMQELLCAADILVTDFSSCMWDFALTGHPVIRYEKNIEEYEDKERGFFVPREQWPFPTVENLPDIYNVFSQIDILKYEEKVAAHLRWMGSYEKGTACKELSQILKDCCKK